MSYCRFGEDSDTYVISTGYVLQCLGCHIEGPVSEDGLRHGHFSTTDEMEMVGHLIHHRLMGFRIPQRAIDRLIREANEKEKA